MTATDATDPRHHYVELLEGIELATAVISNSGDDPETAAEWLWYRARLYRRLHDECPRSQLAGTAVAVAEADEARARRLS